MNAVEKSPSDEVSPLDISGDLSILIMHQASTPPSAIRKLRFENSDSEQEEGAFQNLSVSYDLSVDDGSLGASTTSFWSWLCCCSCSEKTPIHSPSMRESDYLLDEGRAQVFHIDYK